MNRELLESKIKSLVHKFEANKYHYLSKNYLEEEVKIDFINPLFEALGWDIRNTKGLSPYERDVVVEKGETLGRPDYNFRIDGQTKLFIEAKAPHEPLHKINHVLQAKSYAWNTKSVFMVLLTDFEEFRLFDATIKPNLKNAEQGLIFELTYDQFLDNLDKLVLLSKEEVEKGSLDKLLLKDSESKKLRKPVDEAFLEDISKWREELAKDIYKNNIKDLEDTSDEGKTKIQVKILNEAVQKILDRLIFIRIAEDRKMIEPKSLLDDVEWWKAGGKRRDLQRRLINRFMGWNQDFNGEILKPGPCDVLEISSGLLAKIIEGLYFPKCPYRFEVIGVELLGSIYERYLGKTIRVTPQRVKIEEKPEVRKAGGVYYTPQYIVDYIVKNTVGIRIKGKTPKQIESISILDPACGSGSFLLTAFQTLIDYHLDYYEKHPGESGEGKLFPNLIIDFNGTKRLSIEKKAQILKNNIFGVDIDPQAVEIAMMSLYLKCLEGEKDLPRKKELLPSLARNIRCGNSLISYNIFDQMPLFDEEEKDRLNPFDWKSKTTGFGQIIENGGFDVVVGNPPYVFGRDWKALNISKEIKEYLGSKYKSSPYQLDMFSIFMEQASDLCRFNGYVGQIVPNVWLTNTYSSSTREFVLRQSQSLCLLVPPKNVFQGLTVDTVVYTYRKSKKIGNSFIIKKMKNGNIINVAAHESKQYIDGKVPISTSIDKFTADFVFKIKNKFPELRNVAKITRGVHPYRTGGYGKTAFGVGNQTIRDVNERPYHSSIKKVNYRPFIYGRDLQRYSEPLAKEYIKYGPWLAEPRQAGFFRGERVYSRKILGNRLIVTLEKKDSIADQQVYITIPYSNRVSAAYLAGILGSKFIAFFIRSFYDEANDAFPQIKVNQLKSLPIPKINFEFQNEKSLHDNIDRMVNRMLALKRKLRSFLPNTEKEKFEREFQVTDEKLDKLVYELYCITKEEQNIIEQRINTI